MLQLDLFLEDENELLKLEVNEIRKSTEKVRRGMFARHNELAKMYLDMQTRLEILERNICKSGKQK